MSEQTGISWTDHTFNPWWGCTRVSPGCVNCYAEQFDKRVFPVELWGATEDQPAKFAAKHWGPGSQRRTFGEKHWNEPLKWNRKAKEAGVYRKVFCASMADIFDKEAPAGERERLWNLIRQTDCLIWQLLTKRVEGYEDLPGDLMCSRFVWKGFTAEDQDHYDERWHKMKRWPGVTFCSYEPALGPLTTFKVWHKPSWIICGGESGHNRRPMEEAWARNVLRECRERGVAFFMKQMSAQTPDQGKKMIPPDLMIQEFPMEHMHA